MMQKSYSLLAATLFASLLFSGCQHEEVSRHRITGTVTYHGTPVPAGAIFFEPDASQGNSGAPSYAQIKDGKFDTAADGLGFIGGPHLVTIEAFDGKVTNGYAPQGAPLTKGKNYLKKFDFPQGDDVELHIEMTEVVK